jgi:hypothetical protein
MFQLPKEKLKLNIETGNKEMITVGFLIILNENGSFEFWSKGPSPSIIFTKRGLNCS